MLRFLLFGGLCLVLPSAAPAQPFSQSMAQCAGLYEAVRTLVSRADRQAKLDAAAAAFSAAALDAARAEGQDDPAAWVDRHRGAMRAAWTDRGPLVAFSQDYRDWAAYCHRFAADRGIELDLDD